MDVLNREYETGRHGVTGCHKCQFGAELAAGKHRELAYEETPCAGCRAADRAGYVLEYETWRGDCTPAETETETDADMLPVDVLAQVLKGLLLLPAFERDVLAMRFSGMKYREIAEAQGVTMACAEKRHRQAMKRVPEFRQLFPVKTSKTRRRKPHCKQAA